MPLTDEDEKFVEECELEFAERFTDSEPDFKRVFDEGIPPPPIISPWYPKFRHRERGYQRRDNRNWGGHNHNRGREDRYDRKFRPYN